MARWVDINPVASRKLRVPAAKPASVEIEGVMGIAEVAPHLAVVVGIAAVEWADGVVVAATAREVASVAGGAEVDET
jgi:hypothetical protein